MRYTVCPNWFWIIEWNNWLKKKLSQGRFMMFWPTFWAGLEFVNPDLREGQYLLTLDLHFWVDLPASDSWTLPFETHHFLPDNTVYDTESGSYLDSYSSFKQTRAPVVLMYWKKIYIYIIKLHVVLASNTTVVTIVWLQKRSPYWSSVVCAFCDTLIRFFLYKEQQIKRPKTAATSKNI